MIGGWVGGLGGRLGLFALFALRWAGGPTRHAGGVRHVVRHALNIHRNTALVLAGVLVACGGAPESTTDKRVIVLGVDGMDPKFIERHWESLPNLDRLRKQGEFKRLATTIPPQSPVAWSTVTTGRDPGGHGIYGFIHRDPFTRFPFSSMGQVAEAGDVFEIGDYVIPLSEGEVESYRQGTPFWPLLSERGIPVTMIRMPVNFPPVESDAHQISGMGTVDLKGNFGTFTFFTDNPEEETRTVPGGEVIRIDAFDHFTELEIPGPVNTLLKSRPEVSAPLLVHRDPSESVVRLDVDGQSVVLNQGDWSGWVNVRFPLMSELMSASGIVKFYLKQARPRFELYVTPVNIDPAAPDLPISTPADYSAELAADLGAFYTQGMAEDTNAFRAGVLDVKEFVKQSTFVLDESIAMFRSEFAKFETGLFFYYFSSVDQNAHMLWGKYDEELLPFYIAVDGVVGEVLDKMDQNTTFIVMSDHGFTRFDRAVHLNTILMREGFLTLDDPRNTGDDELFAHVDWSRTQAYAMGLNSLYLNRLGRERGGIVSEGEEADEILARITERLLAFRDPDTGEQVIEEVYLPDVAYKGDNSVYAPDMIIGYRPPYRASWGTPLGAVPAETVVDNEDAWVGDHCVAPKYVPGVLFSNRTSSIEDPKLVDLTVTLLSQFGVEPSEDMIGRVLY